MIYNLNTKSYNLLVLTILYLKQRKDILVVYNINDNVIVFKYDGKEEGEYILDIINKTLRKISPSNSFIQKIDAKIKELEDEQKKNKE